MLLSITEDEMYSTFGILSEMKTTYTILDLKISRKDADWENNTKKRKILSSD
jgi:hypothetical protein